MSAVAEPEGRVDERPNADNDGRRSGIRVLGARDESGR